MRETGQTSGVHTPVPSLEPAVRRPTRRPARLALAAGLVVLPLLAGVSGCATDDGGVRTENGPGVDDKSVPGPGEDGDQSDSDDAGQEG